METKDLAAVFGSIGQSTRLEILKLLAPLSKRKESSGMAAGKIAQSLGINAPTLSFHLKDMTLRDILIQKREGREVRYLVNKTLLLQAFESLVVQLEA
jgi:ArsR family transcriptional regulator, arsenate/arsenite/antimonite-responsive transcriptional repressor